MPVKSPSNIRKLIRESNLIEGIDSTKEDDQSLMAWEWFIRVNEISHTTIRRLQKLITINQHLLPNQRGYYRGEAGNNVNVFVGKHIPPPYHMVKLRMDNYLLDLKDEDSRWMHAYFEDIHPFVDGNGRTGRMVMWLDQLQRGEKPWLILAKDRQKYYDYLNEFHKKVQGI